VVSPQRYRVVDEPGSTATESKIADIKMIAKIFFFMSFLLI
jgi:hypothetical protein